MTFLKNDPRPCATLKQVFLDRYELVLLADTTKHLCENAMGGGGGVMQIQ